MSVKGFLDKYFKTDSATVAPAPMSMLEPMVGTVKRSQFDFYKPHPTIQTLPVFTSADMSIMNPTSVVNATTNPTSTILHLFTDGACSDNGKKTAKGGYGVHVYGKPEFDVSSRLLPNEQQTNNRGELKAIQAALDLLDRYDMDWSKEASEFYIWSDSEYSINCLTKWAKGWRSNNWRKKDGGFVINVDLIKPLYERISRMHRVSLHHVRGHQDSKRDIFPYDGNFKADALATQSLR